MSAFGMDFTPIAIEDIPKTKKTWPRSRYLATVVEFLQSGVPAVEVDCAGRVNPSAVASSIRGQIMRHNLSRRVTVLSRSSRVFLVRTEYVSDEKVVTKV